MSGLGDPFAAGSSRSASHLSMQARHSTGFPPTLYGSSPCTPHQKQYPMASPWQWR